jgi:cell division protein FtsL
MYSEDLYRNLYNQINLHQVQEFEIIELLSKIKRQEREINDLKHRISYLEEL